jgi:hypothetical protein
MDAPKKFQVPDSLTSNHSLRKLSLIYSSINDFAILGCYNDRKFYCWTIYVLYIFKDQLVWYDGCGWGGCIQDWYTTTTSEWRCNKSQLANTAQSLLTMRLKRCLSWSVTLQDNDNNQNERNRLTAHVRSFKTFDL